MLTNDTVAADRTMLQLDDRGLSLYQIGPAPTLPEAAVPVVAGGLNSVVSDFGP